MIDFCINFIDLTVEQNTFELITVINNFGLHSVYAIQIIFFEHLWITSFITFLFPETLLDRGIRSNLLQQQSFCILTHLNSSLLISLPIHVVNCIFHVSSTGTYKGVIILVYFSNWSIVPFFT